MDGTALYEVVAVLFIAQVYGIDLTMAQQGLIALIDDPGKTRACLDRLSQGAADLGRRQVHVEGEGLRGLLQNVFIRFGIYYFQQPAFCPLRMRVSMSEIGSVIVIVFLRYQLAFVRPGISPFIAPSRSLLRPRPNLR